MNLTSLPFVSIHRRVELPNASAVYFITGPDYVPLYIGESSGLKSRWQAHSKKHPAIALGADRIVWVRIRPDRRVKIERWLIQMYQPPLNTAGTPRDRRLIPYRERPVGRPKSSRPAADQPAP
jgi:excinuclease UvrABC nuclease subunit